MNFTRSSIKNPAAILVVTILILVFGIISVAKLPIQLTPDIQQPQINIGTGWRAAAPEELEAVIIEPMENVVKNTPGVTDVTTNVQRGFGNITLTFQAGADMQQAMLDVINNLNQAPPLPLDANEPVVSASGTGPSAPNAASLLIRPMEGSDIEDITLFQKLIDTVVEPRFARIPGVGQVNLNSQRPRELRITFDPYQTASLGLQVSQISSTISQATDVSGGFAEVGRRNYTVRFAGQYDVNNLGQMIVGYSDNRPIYLSDVATVEETFQDRFGFTLRNGAPGYYITIQRTNGSNTVEVLDEINKAIKELNDGPLREVGLAIDLSFDASVHIRNALNLVKSNLGLGVLLALGILWMFLRGIRPTLIIATTIPVSLAVAFLALSLFDRSLNVISLAGLAFSVGLVLDAAIIVQENIVRLRSESGNDQLADKKAVLKGTLQVTGALFASTATTIAIFLPILFMEGIEGQLFSDLALTLSVAVLASLMTAITVMPVISRFWLKQLSIQDPFGSYWEKLTNLIMKLTNNNLKRWGWIGGLLGGSAFVFLTLMPRTDFMPRAPIDGFFYSFNMPPGGNLEFLEEELASRVKARLAPFYSGEKEPKIKSYNFYAFGPGASGGFIYSDDPRRVEELMTVVRTQVLHDLPDTQVFLFRGSMINVRGGGNGRSITLDIQGPNIEALMDTASVGLKLINEAMPGTSAQPVPGLALAEPELRLIPDDRRITQAGLDRRAVANAVRAFTGGLFVSEYFDGNDRMNVILRGTEWNTPDELAALPIFTPLAGIQTVGELAEIQRTVGPTQLRRVDGKRTVSIIISPPSTMSLEEAVGLVNSKVLPEIKKHLPADASIQMSGNANRMQAAITDMAWNFALAILILLLLMTALFKSLTDSIMVLLVMPLAVAGGIIGLSLLNLVAFQSLDLLTMIGFIILLGLVVNNAILLVDQTRMAEREGMSRTDAVKQAVRIRARPVYMSTLTSLFGMLPLMMIPGVGSEIYRGLATVIVGGMGVSAIFTLVLMPSLLQLSLGTVPKLWLKNKSADRHSTIAAN
ncbi:efflux RND transporter permease subunit [Aliikangiella coralliicola]|uniref:Efflux RND transporter permease subunit n=1 Tax=Aliikangiella coralliicola TaxID=2592383 RepID=A0A545UHG2_9GAMM|nr:efflux RND transporter permease subunit [Aliikangiella coralliicola]TQV88853.1 efflux RND transporter permease subunit [Aliikangiella coralliicola]